MRKAEIVWQGGSFRVVAKPTHGDRAVNFRFGYFCERKAEDALGNEVWLPVEQYFHGPGTQHAAFWLWQSVHEANAARPLRLAREDADVIAWLRGVLGSKEVHGAFGATDALPNASKLLHRIHMHALGDGGRS